jgi:transcriptional regulator with XRE-family HTH domain
MTTVHCLSGLRSVRHYRGLSLSEAAALIGITSTSYSRIEAGTRRTYFDKDALGCRLDDLRTHRSADELLAILGPNPAPVAPSREAPLTPPPPPGSTGDIVVAEALRGWDAESGQ